MDGLREDLERFGRLLDHHKGALPVSVAKVVRRKIAQHTARLPAKTAPAPPKGPKGAACLTCGCTQVIHNGKGPVCLVCGTANQSQ